MLRVCTRLMGWLVLVGCLPAAGQTASSSTSYSGFGRDSVPAEVLRQFAPPPIDDALSRQIERSLDLRSPSLGVLAPDGGKLYFNWSVTGTRQVWRIDGAQRFPVQLTGGADAASVLDVTPDGEHLVISRDTQGDEQFGIYLQPSAGGGLTTVFRARKVRAGYEFTTDDSRYIYYRANDQKPNSYTIYRYDIQSGERETVFDQDGLWTIADYRNDGRLLLALLKGNVYREYFEWNPQSQKLTPIVGQDEWEEFSVSYGPGGDEFIVRTNKFTEFRKLYRLRQGEFEVISPEMPYDVATHSIDRQRQRILYRINEGGRYRPGAIDTKTWESIPLPKQLPEAEQIYFGTTSHDGRYSTVAVEPAIAPRSTYVLDWQTSEVVQWVLPSSPELDTSQFKKASLEYYSSRDGVSIPMFVWRPNQCLVQSCPVVVRFHGGPESQARPGFSPTIQLFLDSGFIFVTPNVRGSNGYGKTWLHADNGPRRLDVITDIEDCAKHIKRNWVKQGKTPRVGIYGGSYGGYSTLVGMTHFAGAYDAGVAVVGMSSLLTFLENTAPYRRILRATEYGDPVKDREALLELSPMGRVQQVKDPLLILHGANDPRVPVGEAIQFYEQVKQQDVEARLMIFPDEGHGVRKRRNRVLSLGHTLDFFKQHLAQGTNDAVPTNTSGSR